MNKDGFWSSYSAERTLIRTGGSCLHADNLLEFVLEFITLVN